MEKRRALVQPMNHLVQRPAGRAGLSSARGTMARMNRKPADRSELTPHGRLAEAGLRDVLGYQLAQAAIATMQVFVHRVGHPHELRPVEFTVLTLVHENPGVSAKQLANALAVTAPNISMWIDKLEARGLVARERNAADRRAQHIRTTAAGGELARRALSLLVEGERSSFGALSKAEMALLLELLHKVAHCRKSA